MPTRMKLFNRVSAGPWQKKETHSEMPKLAKSGDLRSAHDPADVRGWLVIAHIEEQVHEHSVA